MNDPLERLHRLENELALLQVRPHRAGSKEELVALLESLCATCRPDEIACEPRPWVREIYAASPLLNQAASAWALPIQGAPHPLSGQDNTWNAVRDKRVGITGVDYAIAETGTLAIFSAPSRGRWVSLAPRLHLALLPQERILDSLDDFFSILRSPGAAEAAGSAVTFITGPSRTADIELKLVMGAHGPKELHVITLMFSPEIP
jgi:L-lactate dehydrogenase complex protein LldG